MEEIRELSMEEMDKVSGGAADEELEKFADVLPNNCPNPNCKSENFKNHCIVISIALHDIWVRCCVCNKTISIDLDGRSHVLNP